MGELPIYIWINILICLIEYKPKSVGLKELKVKKEYENKYNIINIDLSKKFIKQEEYGYELPQILIRDLNIN